MATCHVHVELSWTMTGPSQLSPTPVAAEAYATILRGKVWIDTVWIGVTSTYKTIAHRKAKNGLICWRDENGREWWKRPKTWLNSS